MAARKIIPVLILAGACARVAKPPGKPELVGPQVEITWPQEGDTLRDTVVVRIWAFDSSGVSAVGLRVDGYDIGVDSTEPYEITLVTDTLYDELHTLRAWATDRWDNVGQSPGIKVMTLNGNPPPEGKK